MTFKLQKTPSAWAAAALLTATLTGCANINHFMLEMGTSRPAATLQVGAQLLEGTVTFNPERTGALNVQADGGQPSACMGALRFTSTRAGSMDLQCNDGTATALQFSLLSPVKGYAYGRTDQGPVALTFGMTSDESAAYLLAPVPLQASAPDAPLTPAAPAAAP
jgi:hypothetical protein